jgi:hypothetical protein
MELLLKAMKKPLETGRPAGRNPLKMQSRVYRSARPEVLHPEGGAERAAQPGSSASR